MGTRAGVGVSGIVVRVGQGFDIHRFSDDPTRVLVLGGVVFEGERGLHGHSDADAVAHAVTEALLGAAGLGDIGQHFPDTDPQWKGFDSLEILRRAAAMVTDAGYAVGNVDCSIVCEAPKLAPRRAEMQRLLSAAAGASVTVKGRRAEGLGALGRREGIACWASAVITKEADDGQS
jgi:2-C-methyl-D-erythritol 2,4-cyclodiphosphate synthase